MSAILLLGVDTGISQKTLIPRTVCFVIARLNADVTMNKNSPDILLL